jgi:hypothetical protein
VTEALYALTLDSADETTGDAIDWVAHWSLILLPESESVTIDEGSRDARDVTVPAGSWIVQCESSGFVHAWRSDDYVTEWNDLESAYAEFLGDDDTPHTGHYSRLGGTYWCDTCNSPYCDKA